MTEPMDLLFSTSAMSAVFAPEAHVRGILTFESALARAEAQCAIIPQEAADQIAACCRTESFAVEALYREAALAGTLTIPLVKHLSERVGGEAQKFVHWGATSQDAIDTALGLQMRAGLDLLISSLLATSAACAKLVEQHRQTVMVGRTLLQQALPITFGLKAARWLAQIVRQIHALRERRERDLFVQLGGAAGTLAAFGDQGLRVVEHLARELQLATPDLPWHTERDSIARIAGSLGVLAGTLAKIAGDIVLLAQSEVAEVSEGAAPGKGGSSAMPQKHNPVDATAALASARLALGTVPVLFAAQAQEHERAAGGWQAEWSALPDLFRFTAGASGRVQAALEGLQVDPTQMEQNLTRSRGLIMSEALSLALASHVGRPEAQRLVQEICQQVAHSALDMRQAAQADERVRRILSQEEIEQVLRPENYLGSTDVFIDRALQAYREVLA